jgi:hypothetical protein
VLFTGLTALAFAATNQALVSVFGGIGRLVSLAFAIVEAAALGASLLAASRRSARVGEVELAPPSPVPAPSTT